MTTRIRREEERRGPRSEPVAPRTNVHAFTAYARAHGNVAATRLAARVLARRPAEQAEQPGIGSAENLVHYVTAAREVFENWDTYPTPQARVDALLEVLNAEIVASGGEPVWGAELVPLEREIDGKFLSTTWSMRVDLNLFSGPKPGGGWADRAATVAHEARHAEQFFLAARFLAALGRSAPAIAQALHMPDRPAEAAKRVPLDPESAQADEAEVFADSVCGAGAREARRVHRELRRARDAHARAQAAFERAAPADRARLEGELEAARQRVSAAVDAYKALPMEADAFALSREVERVFREGR
jgi:hypothetical protein